LRTSVRQILMSSIVAIFLILVMKYLNSEWERHKLLYPYHGMSLPCGVRTSSSFIISVQFSLSSPRWEPNPSHPLLVMPVLASTSVSCITVQTPFIIGDTVSIVCSSDLDVTMINWIKNGTVVASSSSQSLTLLLDPVSADHHNTQYTCTVSTSSEDGMQEDTVDVTVQSKSLCECWCQSNYNI